MEEDKPARFIFISNSTKNDWPDIIKGSLPDASQLETADDKTAMRLIMENDYHTVFIDFSIGKEEFQFLMSRIRAQRPDARVVVIAPQDWKIARVAFLSGATDYVRKSQPPQDLISSLREAQRRPVRIAMAAGTGY